MPVGHSGTIFRPWPQASLHFSAFPANRAAHVNLTEKECMMTKQNAPRKAVPMTAWGLRSAAYRCAA
jgi:hypothetical protein